MEYFLNGNTFIAQNYWIIWKFQNFDGDKNGRNNVLWHSPVSTRCGSVDAASISTTRVASELRMVQVGITTVETCGGTIATWKTHGRHQWDHWRQQGDCLVSVLRLSSHCCQMSCNHNTHQLNWIGPLSWLPHFHYGKHRPAMFTSLKLPYAVSLWHSAVGV